MVDSDSSYLGIWYTDLDNGKKVWIANRSNPVSNRNTNLTMDANGVLMIMHTGGDSITLNSAAQAVKNSSATLNNKGNFVVEDVTTNSVLWESFDYPNDILIPGMKLGVNKKRGENWTLKSWISDEVAAPGAYSLEWDWETRQLVMKWRGNDYWKSGALDGQNKSFGNIARLIENSLANDYKFGYVYDEKETSYYLYYSLSTNRVYWWNLGPDGSIFDTDKRALVVGSACYGYTTDIPGCEEGNPNECKEGSRRINGDRFLKQNVIFKDSSFAWYDQNTSIGADDCWATCWNNCSCIAYTTLHDGNAGCVFWGIGSVFEQYTTEFGESGNEIYVLSSILSDKGNNDKWWIWVLVSLVAAFLILLVALLIYIMRRKRKEKQERYDEEVLIELVTPDRFDDAQEIANDGQQGREVKLFSFASMMAASRYK